MEVGSSCPEVPTVREYQAAAGSASGAEAVEGPAAAVWRADCDFEVVLVQQRTETLDVSGRGVEAVESVPDVAVLNLSNNSIASLEGFSAPSTLRVLDLTANALKTLKGVNIPTTVESLNMSRNPFSNFSGFEFPNDLTELTIANSSLATMENFTFPNSLTTIYFSANPITRVAGVVFPESLQHFTLTSSTTGDEGGSSVLQEFEVRETDAELFTTLQTWDVSTTIVYTCSDSQANLRYVQNTMLCVLTDELFASKYFGSTSSSGSTSENAGDSATLHKIVETMDQSRTWFMIIGGIAIVGIAVTMLVIAVISKRREKADRDHWQVPEEDRSTKQLLYQDTSSHPVQEDSRVPLYI